MAETSRQDARQAGEIYEQYMGRWSRQIAPLSLDWLDAPPKADWLDVGCGTGALTAHVLALCEPNSIVAVDPSVGSLEQARAHVSDPRVQFFMADAQELDLPSCSKDVVVSGLVLNFIPDRKKALRGMKRIARPGGALAFYIWDYPGGGVEFMRAIFWTAATSLNPAASDLAEDRRFATARLAFPLWDRKSVTESLLIVCFTLDMVLGRYSQIRTRAI